MRSRRASYGIAPPLNRTVRRQRSARVPMFIIEDELHAEQQDGEFTSFQEALVELKRRAALPWDRSPNVAPCTSWRTCGRKYEIIEYDDSTRPWKQLSCVAMLEISAKGARWLVGVSTST